MISTLVSSFGTGHPGPGSAASTATQSPETAKPVPLASAAPHVEATSNAPVAGSTIQAILESSQAQKSGLTARSVLKEESDFKALSRRISRAVSEYDEAREDDDEADEMSQSKRWK